MTRRWGRSSALLAALLVLPLLAVMPASADHTSEPTAVVVAGSLQAELGCTDDWQPDCAATGLTQRPDGVWSATFDVPAGDWEYKAPLNGSWDENYGANAVADGANLPLSLAADAAVSFFYSHDTHWITDDVTSEIATAAGSFQSELGCADDWLPDCLASWLQDPDGDGTYTFTAAGLPAGDYEAKVAIDQAWDENYGVGGVANGDNLTFAVADGQTVEFAWDSTSKATTITTSGGGGIDPGDEELVTAPLRPAADEVIYFVMPDRFANGDPSNDTGGDTSGDPLVNGFLPDNKAYHHGGDIAGLRANLDYIAGLGATAIWVTPQFTNSWVQGDGTIEGSSSSYHGYWQTDYTIIDPHMGTNAEMQALIAQADALGIDVFFDIVLNHTGDVITYAEGEFGYVSKDDAPYVDADGNVFDDRDFAGGDTFPALDAATSFPYTPVVTDPDAKNPAWLNDPIYYHNRGNSTFTGENSLYGDFFGLDDLFTEHPDVVTGLIDIHTSIMDTFDIAGFRVDTVKHVNDEFWEAFVPAILEHANDPEFVVFGEIFDTDAEFVSRFTTELPFPGVLDFGFDSAARQFAAGTTDTDRLRQVFADDDWFTDADSNAHELVKFTGNHDIGRIGLDIVNANPGADDAELTARAELAQALNFLTRGRPIVYYGDEQGFVGDGGDQDARQNMFPSQVASYNDDDLIGTDATTADDNFDVTHPLYTAIGELAAIREAHPALATGAQLHRVSETTTGVYAFSRIDRDERVEYVVALNNSEAVDSAVIATDTPGATWTPIVGATGDLASDAEGNLAVEVPALGYVVYRADSTIAEPADSTGVAITAPAADAAVTGRVEVVAEPATDGYAEVTFARSVNGGEYEVIGTDDNAPYRVFSDVSELAEGDTVTFKAIVADAAGQLASDSVVVTRGADPVPPDPGGAGRYAIVHYLRDDGDYGDHTTGDFEDFWGLHLWGDAIAPGEVTEWPAPKPFLGEDDYGRFAWIELQDPSQPVNFIVHRGDAKDGTDDDRSFDPAATPEIWLRQDAPTNYTSQAAAQGFATIRYQRPDGDYGEGTPGYWGLHLWGDAIDPAEATEWDAPEPPTGFDEFGAFWEIPLADVDAPLNFIVHTPSGDDQSPGGNREPGGDRSFVPSEQPTAWLVQGDETVYAQRGAALDLATIHYHRPDGDYGDPTSPDFNDFWGLHVWAGAAEPNPAWQQPVLPARFDTFGPVFEVALEDGAPELAYILHRGDEKDPGPDQFLDIGTYGHEVWQVQGADPAAPYVYPTLAGSGPVSGGDLSQLRAHWVDERTIVWPGADGAERYELCSAPGGGLELTDAGIGGGDCVALTPGDPYPSGVEGFRHLAGEPTYRIGDDVDVDAILDGQVAVVSAAAGARVDATGLQVPGVLDDLYATDAPLGVTWDDDEPSVAVWAPTARSVNLHLFDDSTGDAREILPMAETDGVWRIDGDDDWEGDYYLFEVEVYVPSTGQVESNIVTDPYSVSLATNSTRSQLVDLTDDDLAPDGWDEAVNPAPARPEQLSIYELHVRDFSATDSSVPEDLRGTYRAFTVEDSAGMTHLSALAEAGLTHVHLLPVFDIATVDEDRASWRSPSFADLDGFGPAAEDQQAAVSATAEVDGFNWGYDPWHYTTPEGSYATDPDGTTRIVEFREMVAALNGTGLAVVMDVVYNHTNAGGQAPTSVLDRIVPGYYHRLDENGVITTSTCCANTATEHEMMGRLMIDSVVTWARDHRVDGFRFDLMGHHSLQNMLDVRAALDALTLEDDGVDGSAIYLYGEGWNFGEVADDARFVQATQLNLGGTGIGSFSDRLRDAVRGGGPFDGGIDLVRNQGFVNGLWYDPNAEALDEAATLDELLLSADQIRVGLAGNLADYELVDRTGATVAGSQVDYNGSPAGYTSDPQENIVYVSAHDNQTLFDIGQYHHPLDATTGERVRAQNVGMSLTGLAQGVAFFHAGVDTLRSKSLDRDSFNSGDWFNRVDWTYVDNGWGSGLPVAEKNEDNWDVMRPFLESLPAPGQADIEAAAAHLRELLAIRASSPLFSLPTAEDVQSRVRFHNTGPDQVPGVIVMSVSDTVGDDLDPLLDGVWNVFNATDDDVEIAIDPALAGELVLHPVLATSADTVVRGAAYDPATGTLSIPARTTAVFLDAAVDAAPLEVTADVEVLRELRRLLIGSIDVECAGGAAPLTVEAALNGIEVRDGQRVLLFRNDRIERHRVVRDTLFMWASSFELTASCADAAGDEVRVTVPVGP
ncbi:MAG: pullulanase-type alpha-1,6-glucosidase [Actinomycetota bacterium]